MGDTVKLSANLSRDVVDALRELAGKRGVSMTEVLRQAISQDKYFQDAADRGDKVLVASKSGRMREVLTPAAISRPLG